MLGFKNFRKNQHGNVAAMFSFCILAIGISVGAAVDYTNMSRAKSALQSQVDSGVLAASRVDVSAASGGSSDQNVSQEEQIRLEAAMKLIEANGYLTDQMNPKLTLSRSSVTLEAGVTYSPLFGRLLGHESVRIKAVAESGIGAMESVEIALVLDNTDSMIPNGKMGALKTGATNLINAIEASESESEIAIVPFARYVGISPDLYDAPWLQKPVEFDTPITWQQATHTGGTCHEEERTRVRDGFEQTYTTTVCVDQTTTYEEMSRVEESRFGGCVGTRMPPYSEQDGSYTIKLPGLLKKIPYQHTGTGSNAYGVCPEPIEPLTDDYAALKRKISSLQGTDNTYLPTGLIWGQRVLSPGVPFDNPSSGGRKRKIMVLMTDGRNTTQIRTDQLAQDSYLAPPYIPDSEAADQYAPQANLVTARLCEKIKAENIEIFTIAFQVRDVATQNLLRSCAVDPSRAYTAESNQALINTFEDLAKTLEEGVRLIR